MGGKVNRTNKPTALVTPYAKKLLQIYRGYEGCRDAEVVSPLVIEYVQRWAEERGIPIPTEAEYEAEFRASNPETD